MDKKARIRESARELFLEKGISNTSVREITERANVAKGTFYLYYQDKHSLIMDLMDFYMSYIINSAFLCAVNYPDQHSWIYRFFDAVIDQCIKEQSILRFIEQNLGNKEIKDSITEAKSKESNPKTNAVIERLCVEGFERQDAVIRMVLAMHFTLVTCYGAIMMEQPVPIEVIRPYILKVDQQIFEGEIDDGNI